jgi:predicted RNA binding protein with dsRBD fold (UPF0201 family)
VLSLRCLLLRTASFLCSYAGPTCSIVLTIVHSDGTSIISLHNATMSNAISANIRSKLDQNQASKDVTITLLKAVAKANNCSSITAAQKGG